jgi:hypothetical protein
MQSTMSEEHARLVVESYESGFGHPVVSEVYLTHDVLPLHECKDCGSQLPDGSFDAARFAAVASAGMPTGTSTGT